MKEGYVLWFEDVHFGGDGVVFNKELTVFLVRTRTGECPARLDELLVKSPQERLLDVVGNSHVVLNRIKTSQRQIKHANLQSFSPLKRRANK